MFPELTRDDVFRIETEKLWLRWARLADTADILCVMGDQQVADMTATWPHPLSEAEVHRRIFTMRKLNAMGNGLHLVMALKSNPDEIIGIVGGHFESDEIFNIGCALHANFQSKGYATEAVQALIDAVYTLSDTNRINATVYGANNAAHRVLMKSGFMSYGVSEERGFHLTRQNWNTFKGWGMPLVQPLMIDAGIDALEETSLVQACILMDHQARGLERRV